MASGRGAIRTRRLAAPRAALRLATGAMPASAKGDKVLFWSENRPEWIVAFWGCLLGGVVVVPIDYRASPEFLTRIARDRCGQAHPDRRRCAADGEALDVPVWRLHELDWRDGSPTTSRDRSAMMSRRSSSHPVRLASRKASSSRIATCWRTSCRSSAKCRKYRAWARPVFPLRFLNLLPLSHMFGQAMATFIPPMLPGIVIFMRGYNPADIVALIKRRRVSVLVSVPKILDVLRAHVLRAAPDAAARLRRSNPGCSDGGDIDGFTGCSGRSSGRSWSVPPRSTPSSRRSGPRAASR